MVESLSNNILCRKEDFGGLAYDKRDRQIYVLNPQGFFILSNYKPNATRLELNKDFADEFSIDENQARKDVTYFLRQLEKFGLINE